MITKRWLSVAFSIALAWAAACGSRTAVAPTPQPQAVQRLAVLGDSLAVSPSPDQSFPAQLQARIDRQGLAWTVMNAGVVGDTTADGLRREPDVLAAGLGVLVVELGANDGLRGVPTATIADNLSTIITNAQRRNVRVLLCGMEIAPLQGLEYSAAFHFVFPNVAQQLSVPLVPFLLAGIALNPAFTGPDGVHPNAAGAQRIADTVWPYLLPLL